MVQCPRRESFINNELIEVDVDQLDNDSCCICMSVYLSEVVEEPMRLSCGHVMGSVCILRWTTISNTCPICRHELYDFIPSIKTERGDGNSNYFDTTSLEFSGVSFDLTHDQVVEPERVIDWHPFSCGEEIWCQELVSGLWDAATDLSSRVHTSGDDTLVTSSGLNDEEHEYERQLDRPPLNGGSTFEKSSRYSIMLETAIADSDILLRELQQFHESWMNESSVEIDDFES
jgi:hypothetical protein